MSDVVEMMQHLFGQYSIRSESVQTMRRAVSHVVARPSPTGSHTPELPSAFRLARIPIPDSRLRAIQLRRRNLVRNLNAVHGCDEGVAGVPRISEQVVSSSGFCFARPRPLRGVRLVRHYGPSPELLGQAYEVGPATSGFRRGQRRRASLENLHCKDGLIETRPSVIRHAAPDLVLAPSEQVRDFSDECRGCRTLLLTSLSCSGVRPRVLSHLSFVVEEAARLPCTCGERRGSTDYGADERGPEFHPSLVAHTWLSRRLQERSSHD